MRRRDFIKLISGAASVWPLTAHAQPDGKRPTIGFLGASSDSAWAAQVSSFNQRLRELGWVDGRTVSIVYRWAEGKLDRYLDFAAQFVQLKVRATRALFVPDRLAIFAAQTLRSDGRLMRVIMTVAAS